MRAVTEFNTSGMLVTKMITYKFLRGVLLRMHDRSHLVIVFSPSDFSFGKLDCSSLVPTKVIGW